MIIHKLSLRNFCQHRDLTLDLMPGLNMLVGPNGSGKTNILRAIQFALIGDAGGDRTKASDICQFAGDAPSFVEAVLSHSGAVITVRRSLRPAENLLTIGDTRWTSVNEINNELWGRLGATKQQIADYIFVRQRKVDAMFDQRPADRAASLASLFGVAHAEHVHKKLGAFLNSIEVPTTTLDEDALKEQLALHDAELRGVDGDIATLNIPTDPQAVLQGYRTRMQQYTDLQTAANRVAVLEQQLTAQETKVEHAKGPLAQLEEAIVAFDEGLAAIADECAAATAGLEQWNMHHAAAEAQRALVLAEKAYAYEWDDFCVPESPSLFPLAKKEIVTFDHAHTRRGDVRIALLDIEQAADVCRTCGQALPGVERRAQYKATLDAELLELNELLAPLQVRNDAWMAYQRLIDKYELDDVRQQRERKQLNERQAALNTFAPPATAEAKLKETLAERDAYRVGKHGIEAEQVTQRTKLAQLQGGITQLTAARTAALAAYSEMPPVTRAASDDASSASRELQQQMQELDTRHRMRAVAVAKIGAVRQQLADVRKVKEQGQQVREAVTHLTEVRTVFHRDEAPRMVSYTYVESMLGEVNAALDIFDAPFRVEMNEQLGFTARFLDGVRVQPDRQLSVGERIVLAMAFRITVNSTFAGQVGVLIMDEPTAGLDEHNLDSLPRALDRLRDLSHERGLQVLFVTHEPRIAHHFDNTIELQPVS